MAFTPGVSGNPKGRPAGSRDRYKLFQELVEPYAPDLMKQAVTMALRGDKGMLQLLLERLLPAKPKEDYVEINLKPSSSLVDQSHTVLKALNNGQITPSQASSLMHTVSTEASIYEAGKLKGDVEELLKIANLI